MTTNGLDILPPSYEESCTNPMSIENGWALYCTLNETMGACQNLRQEEGKLVMDHVREAYGFVFSEPTTIKRAGSVLFVPERVKLKVAFSPSPLPPSSSSSSSSPPFSSKPKCSLSSGPEVDRTVDHNDVSSASSVLPIRVANGRKCYNILENGSVDCRSMTMINGKTSLTKARRAYGYTFSEPVDIEANAGVFWVPEGVELTKAGNSSSNNSWSVVSNVGNAEIHFQHNRDDSRASASRSFSRACGVVNDDNVELSGDVSVLNGNFCTIYGDVKIVNGSRNKIHGTVQICNGNRNEARSFNQVYGHRNTTF